jgi:hypothetical protein
LIYNNGSKFKLHFHSLCDTYGIKLKLISAKNSLAKAILERIHAIFTDMLCTIELDMAKSVKAGDIDVFLSDAAWAIRSTYHTLLKACPGEAIFGQNMLFDIPFVVDGKKIGEHRQRLTDLNTAHENKGRIDYDYKVGQKVLVWTMLSSAKKSLGILVSQRPLDSYVSPYEWNNHGSMQKQMRKDKYPESKTI